jgi:hypothetical protein
MNNEDLIGKKWREMWASIRTFVGALLVSALFAFRLALAILDSFGIPRGFDWLEKGDIWWADVGNVAIYAICTCFCSLAAIREGRRLYRVRRDIVENESGRAQGVVTGHGKSFRLLSVDVLGTIVFLILMLVFCCLAAGVSSGTLDFYWLILAGAAILLVELLIWLINRIRDSSLEKKSRQTARDLAAKDDPKGTN